jgi:hypothetical protein
MLVSILLPLRYLSVFQVCASCIRARASLFSDEPIKIESSSSNSGAVVGAIVGSLAAVALLVAVIFFLRYRRSKVSAVAFHHENQDNEFHSMQGMVT